MITIMQIVWRKQMILSRGTFVAKEKGGSKRSERSCGEYAALCFINLRHSI